MTIASVRLFRTDVRSSLSGLAAIEFGKHKVSMSISNRRLPVYAAVFVEWGQGYLQTEMAGTIEVTGPCLFWLVPGELHSYGPTPNTSWTERWILFSGSLVDDFVREKLIDPEKPMVRLSNAAEISQTFWLLQSEMADHDRLKLASASATVHRLVVQTAWQAKRGNRRPKTEDFSSVSRAIQERSYQHIDFAKLACEFDMSPATLRRKCRAALGMAPKAFQLQIRVDQAKELLTITDLSIEEIAAHVGYDDSFYFSRIFNRRENCAPSEFRKLYSRK